jgi:hypothetical protein
MKRMFCLMLLSALLSGCGGDDNSTNSIHVKQIWPLKVGNQWIFEWRESDSAGNVIVVDTSVLEVKKDTLIDGEMWYIITEDGARTDVSVPTTVRSDGLWVGGSSGELFAKYPAAVNDTFVSGVDTAIVESVNDMVAVPAGAFICYKYKYPESAGSRAYQYRYFSPGVGFIKGEEYLKTDGGYIFRNILMVLLSYELK